MLQYKAKIDTVNASMKEMEVKKRQMEEEMDKLQEETATLKAEGKFQDIDLEFALFNDT